MQEAKPTPPTELPAELAARYTTERGRVLLNGNQALVRLLLLQRERDAAAGLNTAGFVSGYRGSPLGGLDLQLLKERARLQAANVRFEPGVNEDLAATAVWGTQQLHLLPQPQVDGIFALWYGKGPGVDRAGDPIKHGNRQGTAANGARAHRLLRRLRLLRLRLRRRPGALVAVLLHGSASVAGKAEPPQVVRGGGGTRGSLAPLPIPCVTRTC